MREPRDLKLGRRMQGPQKGRLRLRDFSFLSAILKKKKKTFFGGSDFGAILVPEVGLASGF